jgi:hypothetical protein
LHVSLRPRSGADGAETWLTGEDGQRTLSGR